MEENRLKATVVESVIGVLGFDGEGSLIGKVLFPKDAEKIAEILGRIQSGEATDEVVQLVAELQKKGCKAFIFESEGVAKAVHERMGVNVDVKKPSAAGERLRKELSKIAVELGAVEKPEEVSSLIREVSVALTRMRIHRAAERRDLLIAQATQAVDDLDKTLNLFASRIREWYGLHFPEMDRLVDKHETYLRLVANLGNRENFTATHLEREGIPKELGKAIANAAKTSVGATVSEADLGKIRDLCRSALELYCLRGELEKYLNKTMVEVAPNITELMGALLGARLIALSGGLEKLAKMPASTIQVLGAERALFRAIKTGAKPPKHGVIFQHPLLHSAQRWQRGKIARALAAKLAIAARADAFTGKPMGGSLRADLERRIKEIQEKQGQPPPLREGKRAGSKG